MRATTRIACPQCHLGGAARSALTTASLALLAAAGTAQTDAYVAAYAVDSVAVFDTATQTVHANVAVGDSPADVEITSDGSRAYVTNTASDSISVIDTSTNTVLATIAVGDAPFSSLLTPDDQRLYVSTNGGVVQLVDLQTNAVVQSITIGGDVGTFAISPDGSRLYHSHGSVAVIDTATNSVVTTLYAGSYSSGVAVSPDGARLYVADTIYNFGGSSFSASGAVAVFDTASGAQLTSINVWYIPNSVALSPDGSHLYVALDWQWSNTGYGAGFLPSRWVSDIDTSTDTVVASTLLSNSPAGLTVSADGAQVYAAVRASNTVSVIDAVSHAVTSDISIPGGPVAIALMPNESSNPTNYCTAGLTTNGCSAHITATGTASASAGSGFDLLVSGVEGQRSGLFFYGVTGSSATPWGTGSSFMCVKTPVQRTATQFSHGTDGACDGAFALDFNAYLASHPGALGQPFSSPTTVWTQAWFRDPPAPKSTNLSDALQFVVQP